MKASLIQTNFTGGEMTPKLHGRVDIAKYNNCAKELLNVIPLIFGGAESRDGTVFVASTKDSTKRSRLIPFVFNVSQSYVLEFGDGYMRVFTNNGQVEASPNVPYEIATPFTEAHLSEIKFAQSADTMIITHELVYTQRLQRFAHADWRITNIPFTIPPTEAWILKPAITLTLSAATVGGSRTATASAAFFLAADRGRVINHGVGYATITAVSSSTVATINIDSEFSTTNLPSGTWNFEGSPMSIILGTTPGGIAMTPGLNAVLTLNEAGWRASDVGKYVMNADGTPGGNSIFLITSLTSATVANALIKHVSSEVGAEWSSSAGYWEVRTSVFSGVDSFPSAVGFKDQRLYFGGGINNPSRIYASETANILSFVSSTSLYGSSYQVDDSSGFDFKINESQEAITHLVNIKQFIVLTLSGAFSIQGGVEKPITPTNIQIKDESDNGSNHVRPVRIGNELYFVGRAGSKLFSTSYQLDQNGFDSSDVSKIAEHIARLGIVEMAYQREPNSILYAVLADGTMATITIDREENVIAWARHATDGDIESVACVPVIDGEQVWVIVRRDINGSSVRQVERFEPLLTMDSAIIGTTPGGADVWTGLTHLEGKEVQVIGDGQYMGAFTVSGGEVELPRAVESVNIGLGFLQRIVLLPPEAPTQTGTSQGKNLSLGPVRVNFLNSLGAKIYLGDRIQNAEPVGLRTLDVDHFDTPVQTFTGWHELHSLGVSTVQEPEQTQVNIIQEHPLKMHVRAVTREVTVND